MTRLPRFGAALLLVGVPFLIAAEPDLAGYRTVENAVPAAVWPGMPSSPPAGFLGVAVAADGKGRLSVTDVAGDSPAAHAGLKSGDVLAAVDGRAIKDEDGWRERLAEKGAGETVALGLLARTSRWRSRSSSRR